MNQLKQIQDKNEKKPYSELIRFLWHGTSRTPPHQIVLTETGLNINYAQDGLYGKGLYFADNACYSQDYAHEAVRGRVSQMLLCLVIVGDSFVTNKHESYKQPPKRSDGKLYDSVNGN